MNNNGEQPTGTDALGLSTCSTAPVCRGMYVSDRCKLCHEFDEKAKPWICAPCWESIKAIVGDYRAELLGTQQ